MLCISGFLRVHTVPNWHSRLLGKQRTAEVSGAVLFLVLRCHRRREFVIVWHDNCRGIENSCEVVLEWHATAQPKRATEEDATECWFSRNKKENYKQQNWIFVGKSLTQKSKQLLSHSCISINSHCLFQGAVHLCDTWSWKENIWCNNTWVSQFYALKYLSGLAGRVTEVQVFWLVLLCWMVNACEQLGFVCYINWEILADSFLGGDAVLTVKSRVPVVSCPWAQWLSWMCWWMQVLFVIKM